MCRCWQHTASTSVANVPPMEEFREEEEKKNIADQTGPHWVNGPPTMPVSRWPATPGGRDRVRGRRRGTLDACRALPRDPPQLQRLAGEPSGRAGSPLRGAPRLAPSS
ncbi:unnamed protein product [Pleuronectes platessa]|uniref:Uncharacterized protein n=1 Tax=Pleuronectes platessa TaxID=8262 RepID=A0A9N7YJN0_PLEPL|nr:unnamed protein product [Pleuronectes platessa]